MAKQIARLLKTDIMADLDLPGLAQLLESKGRKGDTMLAHITPQEAALLKARGGAGTMNPDTGLPEFYDGDFETYFPTSRAGRTAVDMDNYYTPRQEAYTPAGGGFDLMQADTVPNPRTGTYETPLTGGSSYTGGRPATQTSQFYGDLTPPDLPTGVYQGGRLSSFYAPPDIAPSSLALELQRPDYTPPAPAALAEKPPGFLQRMGERLQQPETLEKLGLAGLQALPGILASRQAAQQGREAKAEMQRLAAPYQQQGQALVAQAQRGELTAPGQQQIQALQARAAQGVAARGGVGAEQAAAQVEAFRQQLLQGQYEMGLKVANIGDQIAAGAIRTGLSADQYVNELTGNYFTNIARMAYGQAPQVAQPQTQVVR